MCEQFIERVYALVTRVVRHTLDEYRGELGGKNTERYDYVTYLDVRHNHCSQFFVGFCERVKGQAIFKTHVELCVVAAGQHRGSEKSTSGCKVKLCGLYQKRSKCCILYVVAQQTLS